MQPAKLNENVCSACVKIAKSLIFSHSFSCRVHICGSRL